MGASRLAVAKSIYYCVFPFPCCITGFILCLINQQYQVTWENTVETLLTDTSIIWIPLWTVCFLDPQATKLHAIPTSKIRTSLH